MKNRSAKLSLAVFVITGILLPVLGAPVSAFSEELWSGTVIVNVNLRKTPSLQGRIISGLLKGSPVKIYAEKDGWFRVSAKKYHQVFNGWVSIEYVAIDGVETPATHPGTATIEPDHQTQSRSSAEEPVQAVPSEPAEKPAPAPDRDPPSPEKPVPAPDRDSPPPEKPVPAPVVDAAPPEAEAPVVPPEPEPAKPVVVQPPKTKIADPKTAPPPRIKKRPGSDAGPEPADDLIRRLHTALPVLAVIILLIAIIVYRVRRASGSTDEKPDGPAEPAPAAGSPPAAENRRLSAERGPTEAGRSAEAELQAAAMPADRTVGDAGADATEVVSFFNRVMERVNRMSDGELAELLGLIDGQLSEKQRKNDRLIFYTVVDYVVEGQYYRDFIQDLSVSGVFIKTRQTFEPGQHILMTFMSPYLQKPFKISGEIVRTLDTGIGVNFDKQSQVQTEAISALMDQIRMIEASA